VRVDGFVPRELVQPGLECGWIRHARDTLEHREPDLLMHVFGQTASQHAREVAQRSLGEPLVEGGECPLVASLRSQHEQVLPQRF
jgi:hypothetical protein